MDSMCWTAQATWMKRKQDGRVWTASYHQIRKRVNKQIWRMSTGKRVRWNSKKMKWCNWKEDVIMNLTERWALNYYSQKQDQGSQYLRSHIIPRTNLPYAHARVSQSLFSIPLLPTGCCHPEQSVSIQGTTNIWSISALNPSCPPGTRLKLYLYWSYCQALL